jgi:hypothetical protein
VGFACFSDGCFGKHTMGDLIKMMEAKTGRRSPVHFYAGLSAEDREIAEIEYYYRRMNHTVQFRDNVHYDIETWQALESGTVTTSDPEEYGFTVESLRDEFFYAMIRRCKTAEDDAEREFLTTAACEAAYSEKLLHMGALMGPGDLFVAHRNQARWSEDRYEPLDYLRNIDQDRPLSALELIWLAGSSFSTPRSLINASAQELAAITSVNDL